MLKQTLIAAAVASTFLAAVPAMAADAPASPHTFTGNFTLASEYIYRGIAQSRGNPAIQGGFDYAHSSGLYAGVWASSISWLSDTVGASANVEVDVYGGYKGTAGDFGYDLGVLTYNYPGDNLPTGNGDPDTVELYGALSWKWFTLKYSHSTTGLFGWTKTTNGDKTKGSGYLELNAAYDLGNGWGIAAHVGDQSVDGRSTAEYSDWKVGVTKDVGFGVVGLAYSDTDAKDSCTALQDYCFGGYEAGDGTAILTFTKTF